MFWHPRHIESFPNHSAWKGHQEVFYATSTHNMVSSELRSGCSGFPLARAWNPSSIKKSCGAFLHNLCHCLIITVIISTKPLISIWNFLYSVYSSLVPSTDQTQLWGVGSLCPFQDICCSAGNVPLKNSVETGFFNKKLLSGFYLCTNECCYSTPERKIDSKTRTLVKRRTTIKNVWFTDNTETKTIVWAVFISYLIRIISGRDWPQKV